MYHHLLASPRGQNCTLRSSVKSMSNLRLFLFSFNLGKWIICMIIFSLFFVFDSAKTDRDNCFVIWVSDKGAWPSSNTSEAGRAIIFAISLCYIILRINWLCTLRWINHVSYCSMFCRHLLLYSISFSLSVFLSLSYTISCKCIIFSV